MKIKLDEMDIECTVDEFLELVSRKKKASIGKERERSETRFKKKSGWPKGKKRKQSRNQKYEQVIKLVKKEEISIGRAIKRVFKRTPSGFDYRIIKNLKRRR